MFNSVYWTYRRFGVSAAIVVGGILVLMYIVNAVGFIDTIRDMSDTENPHWVALAIVDLMPTIGPLASGLIGATGIILLTVSIWLLLSGSRIAAKGETALTEAGASAATAVYDGVSTTHPWEETEPSVVAQRKRLVVQSAIYGFRDSTANVANIIRDSINDNRVDMLVNNYTMGGDPCVGQGKELTVEWSMDGESKPTIKKREHERLLLPPRRPVGREPPTETDHTRELRVKREQIQGWREMVAEINTARGAWRAIGTLRREVVSDLESDARYFSLRPFLSHRTKEMLSSRRTAHVPPEDGSTMAVELRSVLDDIDALEDAWGLR